MSGARPGASRWAERSLPAVGIVVALTLVGLALRLPHLGGTLLGDELSTAYLIADRGLIDVIRAVSTDAEISPPLYFAVSWLFSELGSNPELIRVPALIAGVAAIPLSYLVGRLAVSPPAGLIAAAVMALNPFMVFYSADGRAYTVAIALLLASTLAILLAVRTGRTRWWIAYAAFTCLCMYTHYTTAFVLGGQLLWLLWAHPELQRPAVLANAGAALAFLPWVPSLLEDFRSPTIDILSELQGDGFNVKLDAVQNWAFGYPYNTPQELPGTLAIALAAGALVLAFFVALRRNRFASPRRSDDGRSPSTAHGTALVVILLLATPVAELTILLLGGSDLFGARNLNTASGGLALAVGALLAAAGPAWGGACAAVVLGVFAFGAAKALETTASTIDFESAAEVIEAEAEPDSVVLDMLSPVISPVPLTSLDAYLSGGLEEYRVYLPAGPPPFLDLPPPPLPIVEEAFRSAAGRRLFLVAGEDAVTAGAGDRLTLRVPPSNPSAGDLEEFRLPPASSVVAKRSYPGLGPVVVYEILVGARPVPTEG